MKPMRWMLTLAVLAFSALPALAQFTQVSGTVTDVNGLAYSCGTITASIVNTNGQTLYLSGQIFAPQPSSTKLGCATDPTSPSTAGAFAMQLADNTQIKCGNPATGQIITCGTQTTWAFTANNTGIAPPAGNGPQTCSATLTISGSSQSVTSSFAACPALSRNSSSKFDTNGIYVSTNCGGVSVNCFQVFADAQVDTNATFTAASASITTSSGVPAFTNADQGKVGFGTYNCGDSTPVPCRLNCQQGTISAVNSAHNITFSNTCTNNSAGGVNNNFIWCHDDGAQLAAATTSAIGSLVNNVGTNIYLPSGQMCSGVTPFNFSPSNGHAAAFGVSGVGGGGTVIIPLPNMNCTGGATTGCLIVDSQHVESLNQTYPAAHFRDITFFGGGTDVPGSGATVAANSNGIYLQFFSEMTNVWIVGWLWNNTTPINGISNTGGTMIDSGTYSAGSTNCLFQGTAHTVATMHGGSCGGNAHLLSASATAGLVSTFGVYWNPLSGSSTNVTNAGATWTDHGSYVGCNWNSNNAAAVSNLIGDTINQGGCGNSPITISAGIIHLAQDTLGASGAFFNQTGGTIFDDCGNTSPLPGTAPTVTTLYGDCSITGTALVTGNLAASANWGTGAAFSVPTGNSRNFTFTLTNGSAAVGASPTITLTFPTPFWAAPARCSLWQVGGTQAITATTEFLAPSSLTRSSVVFTYNGTPTINLTEFYQGTCGN